MTRTTTTAAPAATSTTVGASATGVRVPLPLFETIDRLPVAEEHRAGYKRDLCKHWNWGLTASDGCDTRKEVILAEAGVATAGRGRLQADGRFLALRLTTTWW